MSEPAAVRAGLDLTLRADPRRLVLRVPLAVLACAVAGSVLILCARILAGPGRELSAAAQASSRIAPLCALAYAYIRWVYVAQTRLVISADGVSLNQPLATWIVAWSEVSAIAEAGPLSPTHRGGIGAGVNLRLRAGGTKSIPDVFGVSRTEMVTRLRQAMR